MDFLQTLKTDGEKISKLLEKICASLDASEVNRAAAYSLLLPGKKIRPCLTLETAKMFGVTDGNVDKIAAAVEMIHTYSLIHDDLPAMDNDDFRRGKPSCHKVFGEGMALLAGDALLNLAFETLLDGEYSPNYFNAVKFIADCCGNKGMIGGQSLDIGSAPKNSFEALLEITIKKTAKLLVASVCSAGIYLNCSSDELEGLTGFAQNFGIAFQLADDLIDKKTGESVNFVNVLGESATRLKLTEYSEKAKKALGIFGSKAEFFKALVDFNLARNS